MGIAQYNGTGGKQAIFDLEVSTDGNSWETVFSGKASGTTKDMEPYDMKGVTAKYVRYNGHGRTNSMWNSITEMKIYPPSENGIMTVDGGVSTNKIYGAEKITVDGTVMPKETTYTREFGSPKYLSIENYGGYFFPSGEKLVLDKKFNSNSFLEAWFTHGESPQNGSYAYVSLPGMTEQQISAYSQNPDIEVLQNTAALQAVREKTLNVTGMVFWEKGSYDNVTVSEPMIVMKETDGDGTHLTICDPTQKLETAQLRIKGTYSAEQLDERITAKQDGEYTLLDINFDMSRGRSLAVKLTENK